MRGSHACQSAAEDAPFLEKCPFEASAAGANGLALWCRSREAVATTHGGFWSASPVPSIELRRLEQRCALRSTCGGRVIEKHPFVLLHASAALHCSCGCSSPAPSTTTCRVRPHAAGDLIFRLDPRHHVERCPKTAWGPGNRPWPFRTCPSGRPARPNSRASAARRTRASSTRPAVPRNGRSRGRCPGCGGTSRSRRRGYPTSGRRIRRS